MLRSILVALGAVFLCGVASADTMKTEAELGPFVDTVMAKVGKSDLPAAFELLRPFVVIPESKFQSLVVTTKASRDQVGTRYGKTIDHECLGEKKLGQSLVKITCIEKTEKHALPWVFFFYKTPSGWVLNSFYWNDRLPGLFSGE